MAWITALAGAVATWYSSQQQKKVAKKVGQQQDRLYGIQADTAEKLQPYILDYYGKAGEAFNPALSYYKSLASGNYSDALRTLSPQFASIGNKYRSLSTASSELNPRGGMSASYAAELPFREADEKQALLNSERSGAYGNLSRMAGLAADIGGSAAGHVSNAAAGAGNMLNNGVVLQQMLSGGADYSKYASDIGKAIGQWWQTKQAGK
jgi:uncharacterized protein YukE